MKIKYLMLSAVMACSYAHAVVFDAYKDDLEADLMCADYPRTNLKLHLKMLKDTGAIPANSTLGAANKLYEFKANPGFAIYGFPLQSVGMVPGTKTQGPAISVKLAAKPSDVAGVVKQRAIKAGVSSFADAGGIYSGQDDKGQFEITVGQAKGGGTNVSCTPLEP